MLWRQCHKQVGAWIAGRYPSLTADRIATATNRAFEKLYKATSQPGFDFQKPERLLFTIADRGAIDLFREQRTEQIVEFGTKKNILLMANHRDPAAATAADHAALAEVNEVIRATIAEMPSRQRQVAQLLFEFSNGDATTQDIILWFSIQYDEVLPHGSANRALQEVKRKLRAVLRRFKNELD